MHSFVLWVGLGRGIGLSCGWLGQDRGIGLSCGWLGLALVRGIGLLLPGSEPIDAAQARLIAVGCLMLAAR